MDFKKRELTFGLADKSKFDEEEVKKALKAQGFASAELRSGPS